MSEGVDEPFLSVVVVAYDMARELPRTLFSLGTDYQRGIERSTYEVVVVDNGSPVPVDPAMLGGVAATVRLVRIDEASPSPAAAANLGLESARGDVVALIVDGARLASPGLLAMARRAMRVSSRAVVTAPAWHLGPVQHKHAAEAGYDQAVEDRLLADVGWEHDGEALFTVSTLAGSSGRGLFGPMGESSSLFLPAALWRELGGLDTRFELPGGGLVNHDLYARACSLEATDLVVLLGEGTFHQYHGGAATSSRYSWAEMHAEYVRIRGREHTPPQRSPLFVGAVPPALLAHIDQSTRLAMGRLARLASTPGA